MLAWNVFIICSLRIDGAHLVLVIEKQQIPAAMTDRGTFSNRTDG